MDFLQKATKRTKVFAAAEDKAFVSFVVFPTELMFAWSKSDRRRKQRCVALAFGQDSGPSKTQPLFSSLSSVLDESGYGRKRRQRRIHLEGQRTIFVLLVAFCSSVGVMATAAAEGGQARFERQPKL